VRQDNLSPQSIRTHFDNPSPDALEEALNEMQICGQLILVFYLCKSIASFTPPKDDGK
jgi:hypothetical protein